MERLVFKLLCGAIMLSSVAACAGSSTPPPEHAQSTEAEPSEAELVAQAKQMLHGVICGSESPFRACLAIPEEGACTVVFDEAWPDCDGGFVNLNEGDSEHWSKVGSDTTRCIGERIKAKFPLVDTVAEMQACASLVASAKAEP